MAKSEKETVVVRNSGVGFCSILFFIFLVLKLTGVITWSWWWVTAPLWIPIAFYFVVVAAMLTIAGLLFAAALILKLFDK